MMLMLVMMMVILMMHPVQCNNSRSDPSYRHHHMLSVLYTPSFLPSFFRRQGDQTRQHDTVLSQRHPRRTGDEVEVHGRKGMLFIIIMMFIIISIIIINIIIIYHHHISSSSSSSSSLSFQIYRGCLDHTLRLNVPCPHNAMSEVDDYGCCRVMMMMMLMI